MVLNMGEPLVSVVIPVFNGMPFLPQAIASVESQDFPNIEIVIVDAGSSDGSVEWLFAAHREHTEDLPSQSAAETWTHVTERARGEFIMLLCQDDLLYPDSISLHVKALQQSPSAAASVAQRDIIDAQSRTIWRGRGLGGLQAGRHSGLSLLQECFARGTNIIGEPHCILFRREALMDAMPWDGTLP
jgi:glycosyltransferase involved in cell wall biosynthesis